MHRLSHPLNFSLHLKMHKNRLTLIKICSFYLCLGVDKIAGYSFKLYIAFSDEFTKNGFLDTFVGKHCLSDALKTDFI